MSIRMRRKAALIKHRNKRDARAKKQRQRAVNLLKNEKRVADVVRLTGISCETADRLHTPSVLKASIDVPT